MLHKRILAATVAATLAVAACGGGGGDSSDTTAGPTTTVARSTIAPPSTVGARSTTIAPGASSTAVRPSTTLAGPPVYDRDWRVGTCYDDPADGDYSAPVPARDCAGAHDNEIFGSFRYPAADPYPAKVALDEFAASFCATAYETFTGFTTKQAPIPFRILTPTEEDWADGARGIHCVAHDPGAKLVGTVASAGLEAPGLRLIHVAIVDGVVDLYSTRQGREPEQLTDDEEEEQTYPPALGEGGKIYYSRYPDENREQADIVVFDPDTGKVKDVLASAFDEGAPRVSPDGSKIVYVSTARGEGEYDIWLMNVDGSEPTRLTTNPQRDANPSWSPDGERIVYRSSNGNASNIWVMDADGSNLEQLTFTGDDFDPVFSPDGTRIAFSSRRSGNFDIWVMDADGSNPVNLTNHPAGDAYPMWTRDGEGIVFTSNRFSTRAWLMRADGSEQTMFTLTGPSGYGRPVGDLG